MGIRVGIDLGTTFSAVARINKETGKPEVIKNSLGSPITPSVLCFQNDGSILFGEDAKSMQGMGDTNTVSFFKRNMGSDVFAVDILGKSYTAADLSGIFLSKLVKEAEACCGEKIDSAVITIPAYFAHKERTATLEAAKKASLDVICLINEPTAAAFAYGLNEKAGEQIVLIYDLGGGTFDVTIAKINQNEIRILGSDGNHELGGKDWDDCIARYLIDQFNEEYGVDISEDDEVTSSLYVTAESVKKQLTSKDEVVVPLTYKGIRGEIKISEALFESLSDHLLDLTRDLTNNLLESIGLTWRDITGTILVGGSTRMRMIHDYVKSMSGKDPLSGVNVDEAVALGAAIRANIDENGNSVSGGFSGLLGARKQAGVIGAKAVVDVTAHALGMIAISEDGEKYINSVIIPKNSPIPVSKQRSYSFRTRSKDNDLEVYVLQGSFTRPLDNTIIDKYTITKIEPVVKNPSIIEVSYKYNANGVIEVNAVQKETGKSLPIRIDKIPEDMSWTDGSPKDNNKGGFAGVEVILAVDLSGSMSGTPLQKAKDAMREFVSKMNPDNTKIGLLGFADKPRITLFPTNDYREVKLGIERFTIGLDGYGNAAEPFRLTLETLSGQKNGSDVVRFLVVLTDGVWNDQPFAVQCARRCHADGIEVMALGFGSADYTFLKQIASTDEYASLTNLAELSSSFSSIAQTIGDSAGSSGMRMI